ncbi:MAG TPA: MAPEG family protein [Stellaceae bacterium]|nr:MAPEG family protein [Stellaceae bacterium]
MTPDLRLLLWTVALTVLQVLVAGVSANGQIRLSVLAGNRDSVPQLTGFAKRAQSAHRNTLENLPLFIALVMIAHFVGKAGGIALLGAQLFFWGRVAHWLIYLAGIPWLRTAAFAVSVIGLIMMFARLV